MTRRGYGLFAALSIIWGLPYLFIKYAVAELDPAVTVFARTVPAAILLLSYSAFRGKLIENLKFWKIALGFALVEMVFPWWWISRAEQELSSGLTGLLLATVPLVGVVISYLRGDKGAFAGKRLLGMAIGILGVGVLVGLDSDQGQISIVALLMVFGAAIGYAIGPVIINAANGRTDPATMIGLSLAFVSAIYLPLIPSRLPETAPSPLAWTSIAVLSIICTVAAFLVFFKLIAEVGPVKATLVTYLNPAVAILLGVLFASEPFTLGLAVGFPLVLSGSWLASKH